MSRGDAYRAVVSATVSAVEIRSATTFGWFGRASLDVAPAVKKAISPATARAYLAYMLSAQMYQSMYCSGTPMAAVGEVTHSAGYPPAAFTAQLSAANCGRGYRESGWVVTEFAADGHLSVQSGKLSLWVRPWDCAPAEIGSLLSSGSRVTVELPSEMLGISPGFYLSRGEAQPAADSNEQIVRLYWNITPAAAAPLVAMLTEELNRSRIPFKLKVVNDPSCFDRCDAGVLYVSHGDYPAVSDVVRRTSSVLRRHMRYPTPAFTKRLAPGLGLAEDPGGSSGFGLHRCRIFGEGLIRAHEQGRRSHDDRLAVVLDTFDAAGIRIDAPYLKPGSIDAYEVLSSTGSSGESAQFVRWLAADAASEAPTRLEVAVEIGNVLCADAIWSADRCSWVGAIVQHDAAGTTRPHRHAALGPDVYSGTAGVGWFLGELYALTGIERFRKTGLAALRHAVDGAAALSPRCLGFFTGRIGVAYVAGRIGRLLDDGRLLSVAAALADQPAIDDGPDIESGLLTGLAGAVLGQLALARLLGRYSSLDAAVQLGDRLLTRARSAGAGCYWPPLGAAPTDRDRTGYSGGAAGVAHALIELFAVTSDTRYRDCAELAFSYKRASFDQGNQDPYDYRLGHGVRSGRDWAPKSQAAWCHGAPGIALSRLAAVRVLDDANARTEALIALDTTRRTVEDRLAAGNGDYSLCHGLSGHAEILGEEIRVLGHGSDLVEIIADCGRRHVTGTSAGRYRDLGVAPSPGLLMGMAGVGHFYLRHSDASVPSPLLLAPEQLVPSPLAEDVG